MKCKCGNCRKCYQREYQRKFREKNPEYYKKKKKEMNYIKRSQEMMEALFG